MSISVVIPTYNRRTQVSNAIESVLAQTTPVDEIIVVDDGSTDGTAEAVRSRYGSRVRVLTKRNGGVAAARNHGVREAQCEWIAFLDSDDVWLPTKIERQLKAIASQGGDFGACFTNCAYVGNPNLSTTVFEEAGLSTDLEFGTLEDPVRCLIERPLPIWTQSLLVLRSVLLDLKGFDEAMPLQEDVDLMLRLALSTRYCYVSEPLVEIDRAPSRSHLSEAYFTAGIRQVSAAGMDQVYRWTEYRYRKWLALPQMSKDAATRQSILDLLRSLYYGWAVTNLYRLRLADSLDKIRQLKRLGDAYYTIAFTLFSRAGRKVTNSVQYRLTSATRHAPTV